MRVAFVDHVFAWPPPGGAQTALFQVMARLQDLGFEVRLFCQSDPKAWRFGTVDTAQLPFPCTVLDGPSGPFLRRKMTTLYRDAVDAWKPDVVFLAFGRYLKPHLAKALAHYPTVTRYYMYEPLCPLDFCLFKKKKRCPKNYLVTPNYCRRCMIQAWGREFRLGLSTVYPQEQLASGVYWPSYHRLMVNTVRRFKGIIVSNEIARSRLEGFNDHVRIIPEGVNIEDFPFHPIPNREPGDKKIILMAGRIDDPRKGFKTLVRACKGLARLRADFEVWVTQTDPTRGYPWLKDVGWRPYHALSELYAQSDICVVPSKWDEPFGLVAVEAMASGRPVVASRVGGLQHIVRHDDTGFLFHRDSEAEFALYLNKLLDDADLRRRIGEAGRRLAESEYDWKNIVPKYYPDVLEEALR